MSNYDVEKYDSIRPELVERACGGWLAVAPCNSPLRIGVTAPTEDQARQQFAATVREWAGLLTQNSSPLIPPIVLGTRSAIFRNC